jgi:hypothetical protein
MAKTSLEKIIKEEVARFKEQIKLVEGGYASKYSLMFSENLLVYIIQKMDATIPDEEAKEKAGLLLDYFGANNYVIDNRIDDTDAESAFNQMEDIGLLRSEREDGPFLIFYTTGEMDKKGRKKGRADKKEWNKAGWRIPYYQKDWRLHYWMWSYHNIFEALKDKQKDPAGEFSIYNNLSSEVWARGKS